MKEEEKEGTKEELCIVQMPAHCLWVCVCVCVCEREREAVSECVHMV